MADGSSPDDSTSMTFDLQYIPALINTLRRVAQFATILQPKGVSIRFLNHDEGSRRMYDDLTDAHDIAMKVASVPFSGNTRLGEVLDDKIVRPMILDKVTSGMLERPVFVVIITDGQIRRRDSPYCINAYILLISTTTCSKLCPSPSS